MTATLSSKKPQGGAAGALYKGELGLVPTLREKRSPYRTPGLSLRGNDLGLMMLPALFPLNFWLGTFSSPRPGLSEHGCVEESLQGKGREKRSYWSQSRGRGRLPAGAA